MIGSSRQLVLLLVIAVLLPALPAQTKNQVAWWRGTWEEALEEARQRNVPLVIAVIQEGEEANDRLVEGLFVDKKFVVAVNEVVPVICCREDHGVIKIERGAGQIEVCKRFGGTTCARHQDHEVEMFRQFFQDDEVKTPQLMFCRPNLQLIDRIVDVEPTAAYLKVLEGARKKLGPGLTREMFEASREMLTRGRNHLRAREYRQALDAVAELAAVGGPAAPVKRAEEIMKSIDDALNKRLEEAYRLADQERLLEALVLLDDLMAEFDGTPPEQKARAAFDRLRKTKAGKNAARDLARDKKLRPDLAKAGEFEQKGEWLKARDLYRRVVERGEGLPVGLKAKARLDYFAADPDISKLIRQAEGQ